MTDRIQTKELAQRLAKRMKVKDETAARWLEGMLEELYEAFKGEECVTLPGFGGFFVKRKRESWVFKFNPGQETPQTVWLVLDI